jgi:hypothetical protein
VKLKLGSELTLVRFQVALMNTKHRLVASLRHVEDTRTALAIVLLAFDRDRRENFRLLAFREAVFHRHVLGYFETAVLGLARYGAIRASPRA